MPIMGKPAFTSGGRLCGKPVFTLSISLAIPSQFLGVSRKKKKVSARAQLNVTSPPPKGVKTPKQDQPTTRILNVALSEARRSVLTVKVISSY